MSWKRYLLFASCDIYAFSANSQVLRSSTPSEAVPLIEEFLTPKRAGGLVPLQTVMRDQYGNYVIQVSAIRF